MVLSISTGATSIISISYLEDSEKFLQFQSILFILLVVKPLGAFISDNIQPFGYRFKPYLVVNSIVKLASSLALCFIQTTKNKAFSTLLTYVILGVTVYNDCLGQGMVGLVSKSELKLGSEKSAGSSNGSVEEKEDREEELDGRASQYFGNYIALKFFFNFFTTFVGFLLRSKNAGGEGLGLRIGFGFLALEGLATCLISAFYFKENKVRQLSLSNQIQTRKDQNQMICLPLPP